MHANANLFAVSRADLRWELAADLARGGYVYRHGESAERDRYFDKYLVLSRPGLLTRCAQLLNELLPELCDRLAVTGVATGALGAALGQESGIPILYALDTGTPEMRFGGEMFSDLRVVLLEDVVYTGNRALAGARALAEHGVEVSAVVCLLDRMSGASRRLAEAGFPLRALFTEQQLLSHRARE